MDPKSVNHMGVRTTGWKRVAAALGIGAALGLAVLGAWMLISARSKPRPNELPVEATASRLGWSFSYPRSGVVTQELVLPVGRPVFLRITSTEGSSSFWIPEFGVEKSAASGRSRTARFTPKEIDDYRVRCARECDPSQAAPETAVHVLEPMAFEWWLAEQPVQFPPVSDLTPLERGRQLSETNGCLGCHSVDGTDLVGATWRGLYGQQRRLADGSTVVADEEYLGLAIRDPGRQIPVGYRDLMPPAYTMLSDDDVQAVVNYIRSLK